MSKRHGSIVFIMIMSTQLFFHNILFCTTFTVTKTTDTRSSGTTGELRWAIQKVNSTSTGQPHKITFNISGTGPFTIKPKNDLPAITRPVTIDGFSQRGAKANSLAVGNNAVMKIILSGNNYATGNAYNGSGNGLFFSNGSAGSVVKGLVINSWINTGITIYNANNITLSGNFIGTNVSGTTQAANQAGIFIISSNNTSIGSSSPADRNVISGSFFFFNESSCIVLDSATGTKIKGNYVGTNASGTAILGNSLAGITCFAANNTIIGGPTTAEGNVISGHVIVGIEIESSSNCLIQKNYIGTNAAGTSALGNLNMGISLGGSGIANSTIGNTIYANVISGNNIGIKIGFMSSLGTNQNTITNNFVGTNYTGKLKIPNSYGIIINDNNNTFNRNVISGNTIGGFLLYGGAQNNKIQNNYIGLDATKTVTMPNGYNIQLGLLGARGAAGQNTIQNNMFGR